MAMVMLMLPALVCGAGAQFQQLLAMVMALTE
jgi:hypothetical protein